MLNVNEQTTTNNSNEIVGVENIPSDEGIGEEKNDWVEEAITREATPKEFRKETQEEFCKRVGINTSTYYRNVMRKENKKKIVEIWLNEALSGGNEVLKALQEKAKAGDTKAIELYMKFILQLAEQLDVKHTGEIKVAFDEVFKEYDNFTQIPESSC